MLIGTAGHIDHGKTALVQALTGVNADRLPEEKKRGITLDLGYAYTPLSDGTVLGFVDVPGHEKLIHNMLAGATGIDFALIVIAADDGPMPQTREHLELLDLLGISRGAIAITKIDLVAEERLREVVKQVADLVKGSHFAQSPVFALSSVKEIGVKELKAFLEQEAQSYQSTPSKGSFRLAIDRAFTLKGVGTVVTGTALAGSVHLDDNLVISPAGFSARVRGLHVQDRKADAGYAGQRCAIALKGDFEKSDLHRGMWLTDPALALPVSRFQVRLKVPVAQKTLKHLQTVHVHLGTEDIVGRVALLDCKKAEPGESAFAEIQLERETLALNGDRFILRDAGGQRTVAGGKVLDIFPPGRYKRTPERLALLDHLATQDLQTNLRFLSEISEVGVDLERFRLAWNLEQDEILQLCDVIGLQVIADNQSRIGLSANVWQNLQNSLLAKLEAEHERAPDMIGVEFDRLRRMISVNLSKPVFEALCNSLIADGSILQNRAWLHLSTHSAELSEADRTRFEHLKVLLEKTPFNPPRVRDVARLNGMAEFEVRKLFKRLSRLGELYPVARDHYFTAQAVEALAQIVSQLNANGKGATIASLRNTIFSDGSGGRKVAQQILEFFDRVGYTRRLRDEHVLRHAETDRDRTWSVR
ncbi:selenocysteine-specific translation elongation factor [Thiomicrorhabdus cannonii]|uniref:selenocysteine-specific translation elongation factor n=1 Tax=Thiomicrorhabdus cannonii TaxID=2748011 RepID=UPI0015BE4662|nr:selenocysteine-specific translation elongation factor [Thiomicrorhabdus cannonii]